LHRYLRRYKKRYSSHLQKHLANQKNGVETTKRTLNAIENNRQKVEFYQTKIAELKIKMTLPEMIKKVKEYQIAHDKNYKLWRNELHNDNDKARYKYSTELTRAKEAQNDAIREYYEGIYKDQDAVRKMINELRKIDGIKESIVSKHCRSCGRLYMMYDDSLTCELCEYGEDYHQK
jgi:exonuclease VII large subunit